MEKACNKRAWHFLAKGNPSGQGKRSGPAYSLTSARDGHSQGKVSLLCQGHREKEISGEI
jgi:hypothetical protein